MHVISIIHDEPLYLLLMLEGAIDICASEELHTQALQIAGLRQDVVVDLEQVIYMDCSAVQILLALGAALDAHRATLLLFGASSRLKEFLLQLGVAQRLNLVDAIPEVLQRRLSSAAC